MRRLCFGASRRSSANVRLPPGQMPAASRAPIDLRLKSRAGWGLYEGLAGQAGVPCQPQRFPYLQWWGGRCPGMRWLAAVGFLVLAAGCLEDHHARAGEGTDPSLPGIEVSGNATWDGDSWVVTAEATNRGTRTYRIDTGCGSPLGLDARSAEGEPFIADACDAYTEPIAFRPGDQARKGWIVPAEDLDWSGRAMFTVNFSDADGVGHISVGLD